MIKIKTSATILLVTLGITNVFFSIIPSWLWAVLSVINLIALFVLNTEAIKSEGLIKKLIVWADVILAIAIILFFVPATLIDLVVTNYTILSLLLIFMGLLITILVKAYSPEVKH